MWTLTSSHTWLFVVSEYFLLCFCYFFPCGTQGTIYCLLKFHPFFSTQNQLPFFSRKPFLIMLSKNDAYFLWIPKSDFSFSCMELILKMFYSLTLVYNTLAPTFFPGAVLHLFSHFCRTECSVFYIISIYWWNIFGLLNFHSQLSKFVELI